MMNSYQAKKLPINEVLSKMGYSPVRKDKGGVEWVYNSPFRNEAVPSLFVNVSKNVWNDFGDTGGNLLDFVMRHENTDFKGALEFLDSLYSTRTFKQNKINTQSKDVTNENAREVFQLDRVRPLKSAVLENYLRDRGINTSIARRYLEVVNFHNTQTGANYFGLGLKNMSGDYEVRNPKLKAVVGNKDISHISGIEKGRGVVAVFEGLTDFLSYLTNQNKYQLESDVIIMNSAKLVGRTKDFINKNDYQKIYTFLDNDKAGDKARSQFAEMNRDIVHCNKLYENFKDYNEYHANNIKNILKI